MNFTPICKNKTKQKKQWAHSLGHLNALIRKHRRAIWGWSLPLCLQSSFFSVKAKWHHCTWYKQRWWFQQRRGWGGGWTQPIQSPRQPGCAQFQGPHLRGRDHDRVDSICVNWATTTSVYAKCLIPTGSGFKSRYMQISITPLFRPYLQSNKPASQISSGALLTQTLGDNSLAVWALIWVIRITPKPANQPTSLMPLCTPSSGDRGRGNRRDPALYYQPNISKLGRAYILPIH